jgi:hypothetical protein
MASDSPLRKGFEVDSATGRRAIEVYAARIPSGPSSVRGLVILRDVTGKESAPGESPGAK